MKSQTRPTLGNEIFWKDYAEKNDEDNEDQ